MRLFVNENAVKAKLPGLRPGPRWGSFQRSPNPLDMGGGQEGRGPFPGF